MALKDYVTPIYTDTEWNFKIYQLIRNFNRGIVSIGYVLPMCIFRHIADHRHLFIDQSMTFIHVSDKGMSSFILNRFSLSHSYNIKVRRKSTIKELSKKRIGGLNESIKK